MAMAPLLEATTLQVTHTSSSTTHLLLLPLLLCLVLSLNVVVCGPTSCTLRCCLDLFTQLLHTGVWARPGWMCAWNTYEEKS